MARRKSIFTRHLSLLQTLRTRNTKLFREQYIYALMLQVRRYSTRPALTKVFNGLIGAPHAE